MCMCAFHETKPAKQTFLFVRLVNRSSVQRFRRSEIVLNMMCPVGVRIQFPKRLHLSFETTFCALRDRTQIYRSINMYAVQ